VGTSALAARWLSFAKGAAAVHQEYWIPADDLAEFNRQLVGVIEVIAEFRPVEGEAP
jgi:hypothetical protein